MGIFTALSSRVARPSALQKSGKPEQPMILLTLNGEDDTCMHVWRGGMASEGKRALQLAAERRSSELGILHPFASLCSHRCLSCAYND